MTFSVAIRTVPARHAHLVRLLQELAPHIPALLGVHISGRADLTPNENGCRALDAAHGDRADWTIFLEDDAALLDDFTTTVAHWLHDHARDDIHFYPLGAQYAECSNWLPPVWPYRLRDYYCSVALVIRTRAIPSAVAYIEASLARQGFDRLLAEWHATVSESDHVLTPVPCFVDHVGDESTLVNGRADRNIVGRFRGWMGRTLQYRSTSWPTI